MPVVPGKPGTFRIRGQIRAQCEATRRKLASLIAYSDKVGDLDPPVEFLTVGQRAIVNAARVELVVLLAKKNT